LTPPLSVLSLLPPSRIDCKTLRKTIAYKYILHASGITSHRQEKISEAYARYAKKPVAGILTDNGLFLDSPGLAAKSGKICDFITDEKSLALNRRLG